MLTVSICTSQGKYVVVCRMLLSHERKISFRWVFCHALPTLAGKAYMPRVKAIMTDGDSHEIDELQIAIERYLPNCKRLRCGWHLVCKGYSRKVPLTNVMDKKHKRAFRQFSRAIKNWCYTFMRPGYCETQQELTVSKCILLSYLHSRHVRKFLTSRQRLMVQEFLVTGVFPHDDTFSHAHRRTLRSYEESTNSSHEGTNYGAKWHSCPVRRNGSIAKTAMNLCLQSDIAIDTEFRKLNAQIEGQPVWNESMEGDQSPLEELTSYAHDMVSNQWKRAGDYLVHRSRTRPNVWYVRHKDYMNDAADGKVLALHPVWRRTWTVTLDPLTKRLKCKCGHFERTGMPPSSRSSCSI